MIHSTSQGTYFSFAEPLQNVQDTTVCTSTHIRNFLPANLRKGGALKCKERPGHIFAGAFCNCSDDDGDDVHDVTPFQERLGAIPPQTLCLNLQL